jgi:hypothetical protein
MEDAVIRKERQEQTKRGPGLVYLVHVIMADVAGACVGSKVEAPSLLNLDLATSLIVIHASERILFYSLSLSILQSTYLISTLTVSL